MKPTPQQVLAVCPDADRALTREHLRRLDDEYFRRFDLAKVCEHLRGLSRLSGEHPVEVFVSSEGEGVISSTVLAFDYPAEFSLIAGVLFGMGVSIISGDVFTYGRAQRRGPPPRRFWRPGSWTAGAREDLLARRRIIDHFWGTLDPRASLDDWSRELRARLEQVMRLLERGDHDSVLEAKHLVNEMVTRRLITELQASEHPVLLPVDVEVDHESGSFTRLVVRSQDTPAFLYAWSTALSLQGLSIEHIRIRTTGGQVEDEIDFVDGSGEPVRDPDLLDQIKLSVLLTKQFTYCLDKAPDPYTALSRYETLVQDILKLPEKGQWLELMSNPHAMRDLARILGASDFLWEDFIRLQYEALLPILERHLRGHSVSDPPERLPLRLEEALSGARTYEEKRAALNRFKDREIYRIDLDHILSPGSDFRTLSQRLTKLAELVIRATARIVYDELVEHHGRPLTVGGLETSYAILGLGKLGGTALGYASDIELLFVYSDNGQTDGEPPLSNAEFFVRFVQEFTQFIAAKRAGIFEVDLRLRPYGGSGPLATSLESFCSYFGPGGPAHSSERLALVRLRAVGGSTSLGAQIERLRDEFVYSTPFSIDAEELRQIRSRQFAEKQRPGAYNAKFSPGALVDLEYTVQMLQVVHGRESLLLRSPSIHQALEGLEKTGVVSGQECRRLVEAYDLFRTLINGLRMLRGSAKDLFLPPEGSEEYEHLARRMGYEKQGDLEPAQQLHLQFETMTAAVRTFVEKHLGRGSLPGPATGNVADIVLADDTPAELEAQILLKAGFRNPRRASSNLRRLAALDAGPDRFARLAVLARDILRGEPDPDMALNNWERFVRALEDPPRHFERLLSQPRRLEILLGIFSRSQFLADTLIRTPQFFDWVTTPEILQQKRTREVLERELRRLSREAPAGGDWLRALRRFRRRETLRIGTRDMYLRVQTREVMDELTTLAEAVLEVALERVWQDLAAREEHGRLRRERDAAALASRFCVLAFGKLGGSELNYSSDIDLLGVYDEAGLPSAEGAAPFAAAMSLLRSALADASDEGRAYRVDLRLRPYGKAGEIVASVKRIEEYYRKEASLWEIQALLKLRPVAGGLDVGYELLDRLHATVAAERSAPEVRESIEKMRAAAQAKLLERILASSTDVKNSLGGLRDVEFLVQGLALLHAHRYPQLLTGNTLDGLAALASLGLVPQETAAALAGDYLFLRRVEHYLQILEDRQIHALPADPVELEALARRVLGPGGQASDFEPELGRRLDRVHRAYRVHLLEDPSRREQVPPGAREHRERSGAGVIPPESRETL